MIADLRDQLESAIEKRPSSGLQFALGEIELELQVQISRKDNVQGRGKFSFNVLTWFGTEAEIQVGAEREKARTHIFKIRLKPFVEDESGKRSTGIVHSEKVGKGDQPPGMPGA